MTPGNITRRTRSDASRDHVPAALRVDITPDSWSTQHVEVPHQPFELVFHEALADDGSAATGDSAFVSGLAELQSRRTETGEGLFAFLDRNLEQFEPAVAEEIRRLARETTPS